MKTKFTKQILLGAISILLIFTIGCTGVANEVVENNSNQIENIVVDQEYEDLTIVDELGSTSIDIPALEETFNEGLSNDLSSAEIEGLLFMREEEKLAQDVYLTLAELWNIQIFGNIAKSESTHTDAIRTLLENYGIEDPAISTATGEFTEPILQELYDQLIAEGSQSLEAALRVGTAIEEIDILDLEKYIAQSENEDILRVYSNLLKGSRNHLRAFVSNLENQTNVIYEPQYLDPDTYQSIIDSSTERGGSGNDNRGNNGKRGKGRNGN